MSCDYVAFESLVRPGCEREAQPGNVARRKLSLSLDDLQLTQIDFQLKIFPEASRIPIYAYLGVPYAEPALGTNRFVAPKSPEAWNRTYYARDYKPICPQLENFEDGAESRYRKFSEDCLYLNLWVPETAMKIGGFPIVIVITGEESYDWSSNRISGLDLAAEGIIVITIQYRTGIFGWLSLDTKTSPGNLGLMDQLMAFEWIDENIHKFGGDMSNVTLLGHGPMGVYNSFYHLLSPKTKRNERSGMLRELLTHDFFILDRNFFESCSDVGQHVLAISNQPRCIGRSRSSADVRLDRRETHAEVSAEQKPRRAFESLREHRSR